MGERKGWDLTSARSLDAAAEWVRKRAEAVLVVVIRGEDVAFALDHAVAPKDALTMVEVAMPELAAKLEAQREAAKAAAGKKQRDAVYDANLRAAGTSCGPGHASRVGVRA